MTWPPQRHADAVARCTAMQRAIDTEDEQAEDVIYECAQMLPDALDEIERLRALPCDSDRANEWLNENAPTYVLDALWAWRRIANEWSEIGGIAP